MAKFGFVKIKSRQMILHWLENLTIPIVLLFFPFSIDNGHLNSPYDDLHSANRMALMTEAAVNLAAAMRIGQQQQQNQHQQNNQQNNQQQHQVS